jgi:hypothetical protein
MYNNTNLNCLFCQLEKKLFFAALKFNNITNCSESYPKTFRDRIV